MLTKGVANEEDAATDGYSETSTAGFTDTVYYKITITGIDEIDELTLHDTLPDGFDVSTLSITSVKLYADSSDTDPTELKTNTGTGNDDYTVTTPGTETSGDKCSFEISFATHVVESYNEEVASLSDEDYTAYLEAAQAFNEALTSIGSREAFSSSEELMDEWSYSDILNLTGGGVIGYITIEKINVMLPIYHGTSSGVLAAGAGHLEGSSLPVGGESTHCVISAHRGLPSATLFTNLDDLEVGDTFTITVLDEVLTYEVDQITIVDPDEMEYLYIEEGEDYCTLMTCTPYGINTQRLLVRGTRVEAADAQHITVTSNAYQIDTKIVAVFVAIPVLLILCIFISISGRKKRNK